MSNKSNLNYIVDYNSYIMPIRDKIKAIIIASLFIFIITYIFYNSILISLLFCSLSPIYIGIKKKNFIKQRRHNLNLEFKDMLYSISSSLSAGKTMEMACIHTLKDLSIIYHPSSCYILSEAELIAKKLEINQPIELILEDFAQRSHVEDIENFADILAICKTTGGNLNEIIRNTSNIISDKIEISRDIDLMLSKRKLEIKILNLMPIVLILILRLFAPDYMLPVFTENIGKFVVSISIIMLFVAYLISKKIMDIEI